MAEFRQQGEHDVADLFEIAVTGLTLLMTGQLEEHDASFSALVERYRARGPPTCLQWALTFLGIGDGGDWRGWRSSANDMVSRFVACSRVGAVLESVPATSVMVHGEYVLDGSMAGTSPAEVRACKVRVTRHSSPGVQPLRRLRKRRSELSHSRPKPTRVVE